MGICEATLTKKKEICGDAIKKGKDKGIATITNSLFQKAKSGDTASTIYYLKNRDNRNWQENPDKRTGFTYDEGAPLHIQAQQILKAASDGLMSCDVASSLVSSISTMLKVEEQTTIRKELDELKELINGVHNT